MKLLIAFLVFASAQSFAFTSITIKKDVNLTVSSISQKLFALESDGKGSSYCSLNFSSNENADSLSLRKGTKFEVVSLDQNACGHDWGRVCRLDLTLRNHELNVDANLVCKVKGIFAEELTTGKVNKIGKKILIAE